MEEQKAQLQDERLKHEEGYKHLDTLIEYLKLAGLKDLATRLTKMRFAFKKPKATYVTEEVDLISKEKALKSKTQTTKKEYKEIKKNVVRLTKEATHLAKEYKELYNLYLRAQEIVRDINRKGISQVTDINELGVILNEYFTQPTSLYYEGTSLGYQCLDFYRNSSSKYNEDVRSHRI